MLSALFRRFSSTGNERRLDPRGSYIDGRIVLGGKAYPLKDWSRRGFSAGACNAEYYPGDKVVLEVEVEIDEEALNFVCEAVVVWVDRERQELAGVFTELDLRIQEKIMRAVFARRAEAQQIGAAAHA